ncbi:hypothetical protein SAMN04487846_0123 [Microbacterium sp. cf046]|uniref:hypothetical protein n=1 Tax=Microbacterium sp. cf046 TaxID=1761803 RepID=UPI0008E284F3|nr:hypothetical protein [Microbacterium sp. cf046]SFR87050.1 hypothetical protein SAMN04487846_0123 [Microbacterium sp. cf046]
MSMSALPTWSARPEQETPSFETAPGDAQRDRANTASPWLMLLPLGAAAISAAVLLRKPAVRKAATEVVRDPEVREVCKDAGERAYRVIGASWRRHGGPAGLAETFLR